MNRITPVFRSRKDTLLSIYFTAGYPQADSTVLIAEALEKAGVDIIEIGMPYSDPLADGPVIQHSSEVSLKNGMSIKVLFDQLQDLRARVSIPVLLMGYINPVLQYGIENFCKKCAETGVDGVIIPDLPLYEYETFYKDTFEKTGISNIFLVTPQTTEERIRKIDSLSTGFIYLLSASSTTGTTPDFEKAAETYFSRIKSMQLKTPTMIGFGIRDNKTFMQVKNHADGAIIGTAFVRILGEQNYMEKIPSFIQSIRG